MMQESDEGHPARRVWGSDMPRGRVGARQKTGNQQHKQAVRHARHGGLLAVTSLNQEQHIRAAVPIIHPMSSPPATVMKVQCMATLTRSAKESALYRMVLAGTGSLLAARRSTAASPGQPAASRAAATGRAWARLAGQSAHVSSIVSACLTICWRSSPATRLVGSTRSVRWRRYWAWWWAPGNAARLADCMKLPALRFHPTAAWLYARIAGEKKFEEEASLPDFDVPAGAHALMGRWAAPPG